MTPFANIVDLGEAPAARLTPPMASNAMNAPTAAAPPLRTLRRVAPPSAAGDDAPLLAICFCTPPSISPADEYDAFNGAPYHRQCGEGDHVRADPRRQDTCFITAVALRRRRHGLGAARRRCRGRRRPRRGGRTCCAGTAWSRPGRPGL